MTNLAFSTVQACPCGGGGRWQGGGGPWNRAHREWPVDRVCPGLPALPAVPMKRLHLVGLCICGLLSDLLMSVLSLSSFLSFSFTPLQLHCLLAVPPSSPSTLPPQVLCICSVLCLAQSSPTFLQNSLPCFTQSLCLNVTSSKRPPLTSPFERAPPGAPGWLRVKRLPSA